MWNPRMGGEKWITGSLCVGRGGITPAWAGKSLFCFTAAVPIQEHPRMGGEKLALYSMPVLLIGSPPRGRGKDIMGGDKPRAVRITPA